MIAAVGIAAAAVVYLSTAQDPSTVPRAGAGPGTTIDAKPLARTPSSPPAVASAAGRAPVPGPVPGQMVAPSGGAAGEKVRAEAAASFEQIRADVLRLCAGEVSGPPRTYRIHVTFDASGREVLRSVVPESKGSQLAPNCLARQLPGSLRIPPPGANVSTVVRVTIP